ncbi:MAG: carboxypeptidase regulatory-like domain-containing protein, partial [Gemmatimonadota bacterium]
MLRDWLRGFVRTSLIAAGLALFTVGPVLGQSTKGKVQGRVVDAETGAPVAGAQVTVVGSTLGNITNDQGFYFINEVPAGLTSIRAEFIGYRAVVVEDERILAGSATTMNFDLVASAVELDVLVVEGERNPLVPRDQTASKSIIKGETVDQLPLDNATSIVQTAPGVVITNQGTTIRGSRANEEALFIDGVLVRSFGSGAAQNVTVPVQALEQVDITVGAFSAEFGDAQSGVISFITKSGGPDYTGSVEVFSDQLAPAAWRTNFNRLEMTLGGPIAGPVTFFLAGTLNGNVASVNDGKPTFFVQDGVDTCPADAQFASICTAGAPAIFELDRSSSTAGATDMVEVAAPNFVPWDNGRTFPFNWTDNALFTANVNWQLPRGSRVNFGFTHNRNQGYGRGGFASLFRTDRFVGNLNKRNVFTGGAFLVLTQSATQQLALDLRASYQTDRNKNGLLDADWFQSHRDPFLGFSASDVDFLVEEDLNLIGFDVFDPSEELVNVVRSGAVPADSMQLNPSRNDLARSQSLTGLADNLRSNPWGWITGFATSGQGGANAANALTVGNEERLQLRGTIDWQLGRFNRFRFGGEYLKADVRSSNIRVFNGSPVPEGAEPTRIGAFAQDRLDIGDLVLEFGVRWDYLDPKVEYPRTPGFVFNVPDSLKAGFVVQTSAPGEPVAFGPLATPCNGASTCLNNFIESDTKSEFSPRMGAAFPVTPTSTFRLSWGRFVQTPAFFTGAAAQQLGLLRNNNNDLRSGNSNTNTTFARDVRLPSTRTFEFGYRQLVGEGLVFDIAAFNKKQRAGLTFRKLPFEDPTNPGQIFFINVMTNDDFTESNGFELKIDKTVSNLYQGSFTYSFLEAKGTGSDPFTFTGLILRNVSNISTLTGQPDNPPELLLPLEQSRKHNIAYTSSLFFPSDFMEGSLAGDILSQVGFFATLTVRSGLPFTKLINQGIGQ